MPRRQPQRQMAAGRMSNSDNPRQVESVRMGNLSQIISRPRHIQEHFGIIAVGVLAPIFDIPNSESLAGKGPGNRADGLQIIGSRVAAAVNQDDDRMTGRRRRQIEFAKLQRFIAIGISSIRCRRRKCRIVFSCEQWHGLLHKRPSGSSGSMFLSKGIWRTTLVT